MFLSCVLYLRWIILWRLHFSNKRVLLSVLDFHREAIQLWMFLLCWNRVHTRAESVTENRNRYRNILKNRNRHRRRYWKNRRKKYQKKRKFGFCWWRFTNLRYIHFLPLTLRNEDVKLHYPPVLSLLLYTVLENCRNSSSTTFYLYPEMKPFVGSWQGRLIFVALIVANIKHHCRGNHSSRPDFIRDYDYPCIFKALTQHTWIFRHFPSPKQRRICIRESWVRVLEWKPTEVGRLNTILSSIASGRLSFHKKHCKFVRIFLR